MILEIISWMKWLLKLLLIQYMVSNFKIIHLIEKVDGDKGSINWWRFILFIKEQLIYLNTLLKFYFSFKFMSKNLRFRLPKLSKSSYILTNETLGLLFLSNAFIQTTKDLQYVYSSAANSFDYKQFTDKLIGIFNILLYNLHI